MKPLHKELKDIRVEKGVSLEDISRETKIRISFLEKIEEGDFSVVPEPFLRAFLREYAGEVGLDPDRVISKYEGKAVTVRDEDFWKHNPEGPAAAAPVPETAPESPSEPKEGKSSRKQDAESSPESAAGTPQSSGAAEKAKLIDSTLDELSGSDSPAPAPRNIGEILDKKERKAPGIILWIVFGLIIIAAAVAILYFNGTIVF